MRRQFTFDSRPPSIAWTDEAHNVAAATTQTFTSKNIGTAWPTRMVIVGVAFAAASTSCTLTIGGVSATELTGCALNSVSLRVRMFVLNVASGTTATIVATLGSAGTTYISVFAAYDLLSSTPVATAADDVGTVTLSINVPALGVACGYVLTAVGSPATFTWTGMTEAFDVTVSGNQHTGATYTATTAQTPLSVTATPSPAGTPIGCAASFR